MPTDNARSFAALAPRTLKLALLVSNSTPLTNTLPNASMRPTATVGWLESPDGDETGPEGPLVCDKIRRGKAYGRGERRAGDWRCGPPRRTIAPLGRRRGIDDAALSTDFAPHSITARCAHIRGRRTRAVAAESVSPSRRHK